MGAPKIARIHRCNRHADKTKRGAFGLRQTFGVERKILVALHALFGVPGGLAVADEAEAGGRC